MSLGCHTRQKKSSLYSSQVTILPVLISRFCSIKQQGTFLFLPWMGCYSRPSQGSPSFRLKTVVFLWMPATVHFERKVWSKCKNGGHVRLMRFTLKDHAYGTSRLPKTSKNDRFAVYPSIKFTITYLYTQVERGTVRVKSLVQEFDTVSPTRAQTQGSNPGLKCSNHGATSSPTPSGNSAQIIPLLSALFGCHR